MHYPSIQSPNLIKRPIAKFGYAWDFPGANQAFIRGIAPPYLRGEGTSTVTQPFTMAVWLRSYNTSGEGVAMWYGLRSSSSEHVGMGFHTNKAYFDWYTDAHHRVYTTNAPTSGSWHHVLFRLNSAASLDMDIVLDGDVASQGTNTTGLDMDWGSESDPVISIGRRDDTSPGDECNAELYMPTIWKGALTDREVEMVGKERLSPLRVRSHDVIWHMPMNTPEPREIINGTVMEVGGDVSLPRPVGIRWNKSLPGLIYEAKPHLWQIIAVPADTTPSLTVADLSIETKYIPLDIEHDSGYIVDMDWEEGDETDADGQYNGGNTTVSTGSSMEGTYGTEINTTPSVRSSYTLNFALQRKKLRYRFWIDFNSLTMADGDRFTVLRFRTSSTSKIDVDIYKSGSNVYIQQRVLNDASSWIDTVDKLLPDEPTRIEGRVVAETWDGAADGISEFWVEGVKVSGCDYDIENFNTITGTAGPGSSGISNLEWGYYNPDASISGTFYLDELLIRDDDDPIDFWALATDDLSISTTVEKPSLAVIHHLAVDNLSQSNTVEFITGMTQVNSLQIDDLAQSNLVEHLDLTEFKVIAPYNLANTSLVEKFGLVQEHSITVYNLANTNLVTKPFVNTSTQMFVDDLSITNTVEKFPLTGQQNISVDNLAQTSIVTTVWLGDWWYEVVDQVGAVTITHSMIGYINQQHEEYGPIDQEHDLEVSIDQSHEEDGEIGATQAFDGIIDLTVEENAEI